MDNPFGVAVNPDGTKVYVGQNTTSVGTVSVVDTATNTVVGAPIPVGNSPSGVAVTQDGTKVYVASISPGSTGGNGIVSVIDTGTNTVTTTIPVVCGALYGGVAVTPDGTKVYVANYFANTVSEIATATNTVVGFPITVGNSPQAFGKFISGSAFTLSSFPLKDTNGNFLTPYNAPIITVFDHSMESSLLPGVVHIYGCDGKVVAFTDDAGFSSYGSFEMRRCAWL